MIFIGVMSFEDQIREERIQFPSQFRERRSKVGVMEAEAVSTVSSESEVDEEEVVSSASSPSPPPQKHFTKGDPLLDMSSLLHQLPFKRGLSKHYQGKSQSFTSLSEVTCVEDLAKPENPNNKRLKSCKSYAVIAENPPNPKKPSSSKSRPNNTSSFSNQSALFA
ncbi:hypothetical protein EZV62_004832 [Acer yangbiense]|uniref:Uncharacterized protein n=1 Tax=Acer yangbiense TaxID=1000413 RepID=A0A5C7IKH0_9ROSI|nr:hypothetical protein EZV62_004832 [Acer yangbiense]